jgi:hypothetical protein
MHDARNPIDRHYAADCRPLAGAGHCGFALKKIRRVLALEPDHRRSALVFEELSDRFIFLQALSRGLREATVTTAAVTLSFYIDRIGLALLLSYACRKLSIVDFTSLLKLSKSIGTLLCLAFLGLWCPPG